MAQVVENPLVTQSNKEISATLNHQKAFAERFNEPQQRRLLASASHIDKLLLDIDQILSASSSGGFPKYRNPLAPAQVRVIRDYIKRLRQQIVHVLADLDIALPEPRFDSAFSIKVTLQFIEVALEEIAPRRLIGYGAVPESLVDRLSGGIQEMKGIVRQMNSYLNQPIESDLSNRLLQIGDSGEARSLLRSLGEILDRYSFVEFRAPLTQLVDKIQFPNYEIAFFGRVSTGKSSLLNAIMGVTLLPVGVTPITAVPTRIKNGPASKLFVWKAEAGLETYSVDRLAEFVTETKNPGNEKRVARLVVEMPLPLLPQEVTLVDTPGLGSLALEGGAETLAYLPRCDLGVVLVDATSNLQADDVGTIDALRAASIPALIILSKADLVPSNDRQQLLDYTRTQLARQIGLEIDVAPLSSLPEFGSMLEEWIADQLNPRMADAQQLAGESNHHKIRSLGKRIVHALEMSMKTAGLASTESLQQIRQAETELRHAASLIERTREECFELTDRLRDFSKRALDWLAAEATEFWRQAVAAEPMDQIWLNGKIIQLAQTEAERIASLLQKTAQQLTAALDLAASVLTTGGREDRFNLENIVKELPPAEFISMPARYERPRLFSVFTALARRSIRHEIATRAGVSIDKFFSSYGRTLEVWVRGTLDGLVHEFEAHADVFRAQIQRVTADAAAPALSQERLHEDLEFLKDRLAYGEEHELVQGGTGLI
jgi:GTP-binding protein EngB required for normal cell division